MRKDFSLIMITNTIDYLEEAVRYNPESIVYRNGNECMTFAETHELAKRIGSGIASKVDVGQPVIVFSEKNVYTPAVFLGVLYAGCHYIPLDADTPAYRLNLIVEAASAKLLITDGNEPKSVKETVPSDQLTTIDDYSTGEIDSGLLAHRRAQTIDTDPACIIFTSGSTGTPKGVVLSHRNIISLTEAFAETFDIRDDEAFGNQAPLDYVEGIKDIFLPLRTHAKTVFTPQSLFASPVKLFDYLNETRITSLCWASPALALCSNTGVFKERKLETVDKIFFTGSVLHCKHLRLWQDELPGALLVNHYGPTEATASDTYYTVDHIVEVDEDIPIGIPFPNVKILLLDEQNKPVKSGRGEIAVAGAFVSVGYYRAPELTEKVFIQNPMQDIFSEKIYKTGDIGAWGSDGNLLYYGRFDNQIKHMGHRIELSEIEAVTIRMPGISAAVCMYEKEKEFIWLFYVGKHDKKEMSIYLRGVLPRHMVPRKFIQLAGMPLAFNGKPDMNELRRMMA